MSLNSFQAAVFSVSMSLSLMGAAFAQDDVGDLPIEAETEACDYYDVMVATTPIPPQQGRRIAAFERKLDTMPKSAEIVLIGDSQVGNWSSSDLESSFPDVEVFNFGGSADSTQMLLWRMRDELAEIDPKLVILMIGGANLANSPPCAIAEGVAAVVTRSQELWPNAFVLRVDTTPRGDRFEYRDAIRTSANADTRKRLSEFDNVASVNFDEQLTCGFYGNYPERSFLDMIFGVEVHCPNFRDDLTHLTEGVGYKVLAESVKAELQRLNIDF